MPILNKSKLRPDIIKLSERGQTETLQGLNEFLQKKENQNFDFANLWSRNLEGNEYFFEKKKLDDHLRGLFNYEERCFLARAFRFVVEYMADIDRKRNPVPENIKIEQSKIDGIPVEWQTVPDAHDDRVLLYFHGGGWVLGSPQEHRLLSAAIGQVTKTRIMSIDYRLAPENPHPAQLEDCVSAYRWLLSNGIKAGNIIIGGDSAGGHLTLTTLLNLRDNGLPLPAGAVLLAPATDLTLSDESYFKNGETDPLLADVGVFWWYTSFINGSDARDPYLSPLYADLKGLPPLLFQVSTSEMLYSDTSRLVEKAKNFGVDVTLQAWKDTYHVFQSVGLGELPESKEALKNIGSFVKGLFE